MFNPWEASNAHKQIVIVVERIKFDKEPIFRKLFNFKQITTFAQTFVTNANIDLFMQRMGRRWSCLTQSITKLSRIHHQIERLRAKNPTKRGAFSSHRSPHTQTHAPFWLPLRSKSIIVGTLQLFPCASACSSLWCCPAIDNNNKYIHFVSFPSLLDTTWPKLCAVGGGGVFNSFI